MNKFLPFISIFSAAAMLLASGMMLTSVIEFRATMRLDPELERLAIAYYRDQQERREYGRKVDAANRASEQSLKLPIDDLRTVTPTFDLAPKTSPHIKPSK